MTYKWNNVWQAQLIEIHKTLTRFYSNKSDLNKAKAVFDVWWHAAIKDSINK